MGYEQRICVSMIIIYTLLIIFSGPKEKKSNFTVNNCVGNTLIKLLKINLFGDIIYNTPNLSPFWPTVGNKSFKHPKS